MTHEKFGATDTIMLSFVTIILLVGGSFAMWVSVAVLFETMEGNATLPLSWVLVLVTGLVSLACAGIMINEIWSLPRGADGD